jgi:hypothetical protein
MELKPSHRFDDASLDYITLKELPQHQLYALIIKALLIGVLLLPH